jgi:hypothetical protein
LGAPVGGGVVLSAAWLGAVWLGVPGFFGAPAVGIVADAGVTLGARCWAGVGAGLLDVSVADCAVLPGAGRCGLVAGWVLLEGDGFAGADLAGVCAGEFDPPLGEELGESCFGAGALDFPSDPLSEEDDFAAAGFGAGELPPDPPLGPGAGPARTVVGRAEDGRSEP